MRIPSKYPWHVILFAAFPILSLLASNTGQVMFTAATRSLTLSIAVSLVLLVVTGGLLRDWHKAGALVTAVNILFFSYGHTYAYFEDVEIAGVLIGRHRVLAVIWLGMLVVFFLWILKGKDLRSLTQSLNLIGLFLLLFPLYTLFSFWYSTSSVRVTKLSESPPLNNLEVSADSPDVYFFILDQYARSDVLREYFRYDNSEFLRGLEQHGFYVATCSQSNYPYTTASLAATLNLNYVSDLGEDFKPENKSYLPMQQAIKHNRVKAAFQGMGYRVIAFETGYPFTELEDADIFYRLPSKQINNFEALLLRSSAMLLPGDLGLLERYILTEDARKRERILFVLDQLEELPSLPGKKFVFVHLAMPHPPFVFGPNGEDLVVEPYYENGETGYRRDDFRRGYHNQVVFISSKILETVSKIIENSPQTPVIMIQGDHGPITIPNEKRMEILSAYLFPDAQPDFYPALTPVNNFRLLFDTYFDASLPLLPDQSFDVDITRPYVFRETPNPCVPVN